MAYTGEIITGEILPVIFLVIPTSIQENPEPSGVKASGKKGEQQNRRNSPENTYFVCCSALQ